MITAATGEVGFEKGVRILPHHHFPMLLCEVVRKEHHRVSGRKLPIAGWYQHELGIHKSNHGDFQVEVVTGSENRVEGVFLSHEHAFYECRTPDDAERRVFHEHVIATELRGQREFSWGHVFCRVDIKANRDWLVIIYNPFSNVPLHAREAYRQLFAREKPPQT
ncbi:MAG TPA: hypothetical protein VG733_00965 [Chthoniobacteraceae bacterium]|nr:hypothetical protein [Chthoniobacteraceae bacterium]